MRTVLSAVVCLLVVSAAFAGQDPFRPASKEELALQRVAFAPDATAVVLDWSSEHDDSKRFAREYLRIKVLSEEGRKYANVEIPYDDKSSVIQDLRARTIEPDGTIVPFTGEVFQKTVIKGRGVSVAAKTFSFPDVRTGSILEYTYTHSWSGETYERTLWYVERDIPVVHQHRVFRPFRELGAYYVTVGLAPGVKPSITDHVFDFEVRDMPPYGNEPYALAGGEHAARVLFIYKLARGTVEEYWTDASTEVTLGIEKFIGNSLDVKNAVGPIIAGAATDEEKLRKIYASVQQFENLSDEKKTGEDLKREKKRTNKSVDDVLRNGYGTGYDIDLLFVAFARAAGISADPVLLADRTKPFSKKLPYFYQLTSLAVVADVGGSLRYFDPAFHELPFGMLHYENSGVEGLRLPKKAAVSWVTTPPSDAALSVSRRTASLHIDGDGVAGTLHVELTGFEAFRRRHEKEEGDDASRRKLLEDEVKAWLPAGGTAKLTHWSAWKTSEEPLTADFDVTLPGVVSTAGSRVLVPLSLLETATKNPFTSEMRRYDVYFDYAHRVEDSVSLRLPDGFSLGKIPEKTDLIEGPLAFHTSAKADGATIVFHRDLTMGIATIPNVAYARFRSFMMSVAQADALPAVLEKSK
jgi:hypothetical protein